MGKHQHPSSLARRKQRLRGLEFLESREMLTVAVDAAPEVSQSAWVKRLYLDVLGRPAGDQEATYWVERLSAGVTKATIAQSILDGRERRSGAVNDYYQKVLGRDVDPAGLEFWLGVWDRTGGPEVVRASLIGSGEYFQKAGGTNQRAIQALYNDLLRRSAVDVEEDYWLEVMSKAALSNVAYGFITSDEFRLQAVDQWYHDYLHRNIDPGGGNYWVSLLKSGLTQSQAQASLLAGMEYVTQPFIDIRSVGAIANDSIDDTSAIQAAFTAADSAGNSLVYIPSGVFIVSDLYLYGDHIKVTGPGTLKLRNASSGEGVLTVYGDYNVVSRIKIDGNSTGGHTGRAEGLRVVGDYNRIFRVEVSNTLFDPTGTPSGINFLVASTGNQLIETRSLNAGYTGYRQMGIDTLYRDIVAIDSRVKGFNATGNNSSFTVDGAYITTSVPQHPNGVCSFQVDPGPGSLVSRIVLRNMTIIGPENSAPATAAAAKIALTSEVLIENSSFISPRTNVNSLRFAEGVGRVTIRNSYLSRNLFMQQDTHDGSGVDDPMDELYMENVTIGDGVHNPSYAMEDVEVGKLTILNCSFVGYLVAAIDWEAADATYTLISTTDSRFQGYNSSQVTYDIVVNALGALNPNKVNWLRANRSNAAGGGVAFSH